MRHDPLRRVIRQVQRDDSLLTKSWSPELDPRAEHLVDLLFDPLGAVLFWFGAGKERVRRAVSLVSCLP